jgi:pilus assembly protein TadC
MPEKIPVMLFTLHNMEKLGRRLKPIGKLIIGLQPGLGTTLPKIGYLDLEPEAYGAAACVSSLFYALVFFIISFVVITLRGTIGQPLGLSLAIGFGTWFIFLMLHMGYPGILVRKMAAKESKDLMFALREIIMGIDSGVPLFDSIKNVGTGEYGYVSAAFSEIVRSIEGGMSEVDALRSLALRSESEYMKRTLWQMVNTLESGASMGAALDSMVESIEGYTYREIKNYSTSLNFLLLIYMLVASVVPSLGITLMVLLSAFSGLGVDVGTIALLVGCSMGVQIVMIGYMGSTRPELFGG